MRQSLRLPMAVLFCAALAGCSSRETTPAPRPTDGPRTLTLVTYNVMVDPIEYPARRQKMNALLGECNADIIALQEVSELHAEELAAADWVKKGGYHYLNYNKVPASWRALFVLSRFPIEQVDRLEIGSRVGRGALVIRVRVGGRSLAVANVWLDSRLDWGETRAQELDVIFPKIASADDAVVMGDCNFGDGEQPETSHIDRAYTDLWPAMHPGDPGLTWNIERSSLARAQSFPKEKSRRLDRIFLRSAVWKPKTIRIIGDVPFKRVKVTDPSFVPLSGEKIDELDIFPSDHFGLITTLARD